MNQKQMLKALVLVYPKFSGRFSHCVVSNEPVVDVKGSKLLSHFSGRFSHCVVCNEPVVDVEHDEEGGEAGDGEDVKDSRVVDHKADSVC